MDPGKGDWAGEKGIGEKKRKTNRFSACETGGRSPPAPARGGGGGGGGGG